ncbi:MAG: putative dipeptide transporter precursor, rane component [Actinomycetia bacterium]|nr:putative dipeptide transporter precursor, rane component [Actinomycetes bacterium]
MKRSSAVGALVLTLALLAAACGGATISASGGDVGPGARGAAKINPKATLVYGLPMTGAGFSQRLQPAQLTAICDAVVGNQIYGTLIRRDTKTNKPVPNLAASWRVVDPSTFEFKLRPNLTFQDGTKLDAAAAKAAMDITRAPTSKLNPTLGAISSIDAGTDGLTVTLHLATPSAGIMPLTLAGREGYIAAAASTDTHPIGAGPFTFDSQTIGQKISLTKFDGYWDAKNVKLGGLQYVEAELPNQVNSVIAGDLDMVDGGTDVNAPAAHNPDVKIETAPGSDYWKLNWNTSKAPFDNLNFRKALNYAVDKKTIAKTLFGASAQVATQPYPTSFKDQYQKDLANKYPYSLKKAKAAMKASGVATPVTVQAQLPANFPTFTRFAEIIQSEFKAIGVNVVLTPSPNLLTTFFQQGNGQFITTLWPARPDPSVTIYRQFAPGQLNNTGNNYSPTIVTALTAIQTAATPAASKAGYKTAVDTIVNNAYELPVVFPTLTNVHRTYVTSNDWQIYGACQGIDFSKVAITTAKK